jgi:hypothetical protein
MTMQMLKHVVLLARLLAMVVYLDEAKQFHITSAAKRSAVPPLSTFNFLVAARH